MKKIIVFIAISTMLPGCMPDTKTKTVDVVLSWNQSKPFVHTEEIRTFIISGIGNYENAERDSIFLNALKRIKVNDTAVIDSSVFTGELKQIRLYPFMVRYTHNQKFMYTPDGYHVYLFNQKTHPFSTKLSDLMPEKKGIYLVLIVILILVALTTLAISFVLTKKIKNWSVRITIAIIICLSLSIYTALTFSDFIFIFWIFISAILMIPSLYYWKLKLKK